jgi:hypothetical protein
MKFCYFLAPAAPFTGGNEAKSHYARANCSKVERQSTPNINTSSAWAPKVKEIPAAGVVWRHSHEALSQSDNQESGPELRKYPEFVGCKASYDSFTDSEIWKFGQK